MKWYGKYGRKVSWIVKSFGKHRRKLWNDMENMEKCEMIWKIWRKSKLNSEKIGKIWKKPVSRAAAATIYPSSSSSSSRHHHHHHSSSSHQALRRSRGSDDHCTEFCVITCWKCCMKKISEIVRLISKKRKKN